MTVVVNKKDLDKLIDALYACWEYSYEFSDGDKRTLDDAIILANLMTGKS